MSHIYCFILLLFFANFAISLIIFILFNYLHVMFYSLWMCFCIVKTISLLTFNKTNTSIQTAHFPQIDVMAFDGWPHFGHLTHISFAFILSRDSGSRVQARQRQVKQYWLRRACCLSDVVMWPTCGPRINMKYCHTRKFQAHERSV